MNTNPVLVEAWRADSVESFHRGAFVVLDAQGHVVASAGDIERPVFPRSAIKLLQALPLVESGAADRFALGADDLALACASHGGEAAHTRTAASMLAKAGLDAGVLECGAHWPYDEPSKLALAAAGDTPGALHNNCSGKHAGFGCLACVIAGAREPRAFLSGYVDAAHPVMREVGAAIEAATGWRLADAPRATDGCSIPTYAIPLRHLALAFARIAGGSGLSAGHATASRRLREAIAAAPFMAQFGTRVCCKVGAEGVYCAALPEAGLGVALKMDDGNTARAAEVVMAALLQAFVAPRSDADAALLAELAAPRLNNWRGLEVGRLAPHEQLRQAAKRAPA
jgi:L-asparaginase II